ncbi:MAG TPA: amidohydrolase family protein, partial [Bryobacteraceae bacterium]|nr:amidohydrolase family protein [Bryobacteraceae bacterium]
MNRRSFLGITAGAACNCDVVGAAPIPVIDTHIHLFNPARPQGVPWPDKNNAVLYRPAMPGRYRSIAAPLGVSGAIEVEASPWLEDNQWVLDVAAKDTIIVGTIGNLEPGKPEFAKQLERFHRNPLFRGIRYGNLWGRNLAADLGRPEFIADLKLVAQAGLTLDTANPNPELIEAVVRVTDQVPELRVVIDHLPQMQQPAPPATVRTYQAHLHEIGQRPQIYVKISEVFRRINGEVPRDLHVYRGTLDQIFGTFGEDRVLFGSDWPNSDLWRPYPEVLALVREYFAAKGPVASAKYFWQNSIKAYR